MTPSILCRNRDKHCKTTSKIKAKSEQLPRRGDKCTGMIGNPAALLSVCPLLHPVVVLLAKVRSVYRIALLKDTDRTQLFVVD